jgi:hypothetical protein
MLKGTFDGLQRYFALRKKLLVYQLNSWRLERELQRKRNRLNIADTIDYAYAALWPVEDKDLILEEYKRIRLGESLPTEITRKIERYFNDQTVYYEGSYKRFEPLQCVKTIDQILDEGLSWMTQMHVGRSQVLMGYISQGTDTTDPDRTDTELGAEVVRENIIDKGGYIDFLGHNELYGLIFAFDQADIECAESGLHNTDDPATDITLCHNKYNPALSHQANANAISINIVIQHRGF